MKKRKLNKQLPQILTMQCKDKTLKNIRYKKKHSHNKSLLDSSFKKQKFKSKMINNSQCWIGIICRKKKKIKKGTSLGLYTRRKIRNQQLDKYYAETNLAPYAICKSGKKKMPDV